MSEVRWFSHTNMDAGEREVSIGFDQSSDMARVYTSWPGWYEKLRRNPAAKLVHEDRTEDGLLLGAQFDIPVRCVSLRSGKKRLSREHVAAMQAGRKRAKNAA
jgi:hypothetical protein